MMDVSYINSRSLNVPLNSLGYRDIEFDNIDWSETYIMQGCSFVCGVSIPNNDDTIPSLLSAKLNRKVVNLGVLGSSIQLQYMNAIHMIEKNIIPKGVFVLYPFAERFLSFHPKTARVIQYGPNFATNGIDDKTNFLKLTKSEKIEWMTNNAKIYNRYFLRGYKLLWKGLNVPLYEVSMDPGLADTTFTYKDILDLSIDGVHWGPKTNEKLSVIFENIYNENRK